MNKKIMKMLDDAETMGQWGVDQIADIKARGAEHATQKTIEIARINLEGAVHWLNEILKERKAQP